jgi:formylglycine-generating enzyme required for sulfatase activity
MKSSGWLRFPLLGISSALALCGSDLRFSYSNDNGLSITASDSAGQILAGPEALVRWNETAHAISRRQPDGTWVIEPAAKGLVISVRPSRPGQYGELVFDIEVRNTTPDTVTGALMPTFTDWSTTEDSIRSRSSDHMVLTSYRAIVGTIGTQKAWSGGSEFENDVFATIPARDGRHYVAAALLANPQAIEHNRNTITLKSGQRCAYELHIDSGTGGRNTALHDIYRVRGSYRVNPAAYRFDAYQDPQLGWARDLVASWLNWAWDKDNLDPRTGEYRLLDSLARAKQQFGGYDAFILWPFWPRAGFDARSQFDHYRDLPGGLEGVRHEFRRMRDAGVHVFISYCHWSESDRDASPAAMASSYQEFAQLACQLEADGALMDLMSKTPDEILRSAANCGRRLVPYNEGDPTWSDTQTNLLGRIHNDVAMPEFNIKKYMLPHHPQLRVCEPGNSGKRMRNDFVLSFFNGHGVEINTMFPQKNPAADADWPILARALDLLRTNRACFRSQTWEPLVASEDPSVWINRWPGPECTLFTLTGTSPGGHHGPMLKVPHRNDEHYVDLWRYRPLEPQHTGGTDVLSYDVDGYVPGQGVPTGSGDYSPGCIGVFRRRLGAWLDFETLHIEVPDATEGDRVELWIGTVAPGAEPLRFPAAKSLEVDLYQKLGRHTNEALILRLLDNGGQTKDVFVIPEAGVRFFRIDKPIPTRRVAPGEKPDRMVRIPGGHFRYFLTNPPPPESFPFAEPPFQPTYAYLPGAPPVDREVDLKPFWIDRFPVTNREYWDFVAAAGYRPRDATNFLKHFVNGKPRPGEENHPVVYVSYDDAKAYAAWVGKRLPTEEEWQFAAGASDGRAWPWGNQWEATRANTGGGTAPVDAHPSGASTYGVEDLVGNVWQLTASLMDNGRHLTVMLRGGSWYQPPRGRWWVPGGPRRITENYPLPLDGPAMNRVATVGFRCVRDQ